MTARLVLTHAMSPLHAGTGQGIGIVDLPIAREKATYIPYLPGSSLKGVLRAACTDIAIRARVFGPETANASDHAGSAQFSDLTLLLFPVRSLMGTFAWVTSPYVLRRFHRDLSDLGAKGLPAAIPGPADTTGCLTSPGTTLRCADRVVLEDLDLVAKESPETKAWATWIGTHLFGDDHPDAPAWRGAVEKQVCVVHDDIFRFLVETATEVVARIKLQEELKTVQRGGLWYEESLPAESILWGVMAATPVRVGNVVTQPAEICDRVAELVKKPFQLGGKATVGRGLCRVKVVAP